jgi:hypothetical protein
MDKQLIIILIFIFILIITTVMVVYFTRKNQDSTQPTPPQPSPPQPTPPQPTPPQPTPPQPSPPQPSPPQPSPPQPTPPPPFQTISITESRLNSTLSKLYSIFHNDSNTITCNYNQLDNSNILNIPINEDGNTNKCVVDYFFNPIYQGIDMDFDEDIVGFIIFNNVLLRGISEPEVNSVLDETTIFNGAFKMYAGLILGGSDIDIQYSDKVSNMYNINIQYDDNKGFIWKDKGSKKNITNIFAFSVKADKYTRNYLIIGDED